MIQGAGWFDDRERGFSLSRYRADQRWDFLARTSFSLSRPVGRDGSGEAGEGGSGEAGEGGSGEAGEGGNWTAWGRGSVTDFRGIEGDLSLRGDVVTGTVGVDLERGRFLTGLSVGRSRGQGGFSGGRPARHSAARAAGEAGSCRPDRSGEESPSRPAGYVSAPMMPRAICQVDERPPKSGVRQMPSLRTAVTAWSIRSASP